MKNKLPKICANCSYQIQFDLSSDGKFAKISCKFCGLNIWYYEDLDESGFVEWLSERGSGINPNITIRPINKEDRYADYEFVVKRWQKLEKMRAFT